MCLGEVEDFLSVVGRGSFMCGEEVGVILCVVVR